jgi:cellulose synthase operon protein YhjQ
MSPPKIALVGLDGGAGRTTVVAHLARSFHLSGKVPMAFDLDPRNALGLHLGMRPGDPMGLCRPELDRPAVAELLRRHGASIPFLPFGSASEHDVRTLEHQTARDSSWLEGRLERFIPNNCRYILIDSPACPGPWQRAALAACELALIVVRPDAGSFAALPQLEELLAHGLGGNHHERTAYVINRFDPCRTLDLDVRAAFAHVLGSRLLPTVVHECASVAEALARGDTVDPSGPTRVARDFAALAKRVRGLAQTARQAAARAGSAPSRRRLAAVSGMMHPEGESIHVET